MIYRIEGKANLDLLELTEISDKFSRWKSVPQKLQEKVPLKKKCHTLPLGTLLKLVKSQCKPQFNKSLRHMLVYSNKYQYKSIYYSQEITPTPK